MKIRTDFISNSSSCSFFVQLKTQEQVDAFKKLAPFIEDKQMLSMGYWDTLESLSSYFYGYKDFDETFNSCYEKEDWYKDLVPGNVVNLSTGDDNWESIENYNDVLSAIENSPVKFPIYQDDMAHQTAGEIVPKPKRKPNNANTKETY